MSVLPFVPQTLTVHLGSPSSDAPNVRVSFPYYIKNVVSSEIYPTWPEASLKANIYAIVSFTLNRIYTDWYPSRGYNFDITSDTQYDQAFVRGRELFSNISDLVDEQFNSYVRKIGNIDPLFAQYCDGQTVTCSGLSQWGTVTLANRGYTAFDILQYYYGDNIEIVNNAPVKVNMGSYPGVALKYGDIGADVYSVQVRLNRVSKSYPSIPLIYSPDGIFGPETVESVKEFQKIFSLDQDGIVGKQTWYRLAYIYTAVKRLADINSEGVVLSEVDPPLEEVLREGDVGIEVSVLQYYLATLAEYNDYIPQISIDGYFGPLTKNCVLAVQEYYGLSQDGIVGRRTWNVLSNEYKAIIASAPPTFESGEVVLFPGTVLREGFEGPYVRLLQEYLVRIADANPAIYKTQVTGYFGTKTKRAVSSFQTYYGFVPDGLVGPILWNSIVDEYLRVLAE